MRMLNVTSKLMFNGNAQLTVTVLPAAVKNKYYREKDSLDVLIRVLVHHFSPYL